MVSIDGLRLYPTMINFLTAEVDWHLPHALVGVDMAICLSWQKPRAADWESETETRKNTKEWSAIAKEIYTLTTTHAKGMTTESLQKSE